ncbi:hypothetical protein [Rhodococcus sp. IEGM 1330]|uniref:hypothetical protein n=1 Tax=Rhodococcus sp. IEGM 1330 TaxID=3082225 RepID=UPI0029552A70|nr:hypothetical protein [Rhodococcus sp. IEGM 1330]MDV8022264.1 hypothetical protein [Rhodococcus sp. IEGM 1330]
METKQVDPSEIEVNDHILIWTTESNDGRGPRQFEVHKIRSVEEPDSTHPDAYDFEYYVDGADPLKFTAGVRFPRTLQVTKVILPPPNIWVERG